MKTTSHIILAALLAVSATFAGCSSSPEGEGAKPSSLSVGFEFGTRTVAGPVIDIFGYSVGFGVFLPSKTIEELQKVEGSK